MAPKNQKKEKRENGSGAIYKCRHGFFRVSYYDQTFSPPKRSTAYLYDEAGNKIKLRSKAEKAAEEFLKKQNIDLQITSKEEAIQRIVEYKRLITDLEKDLDLIWQQFEQRIYGEVKPKTFKCYAWAWKRFSDFVTTHHKKSLTKFGITSEIMDAFFLMLRKIEFTSKSYNNLRTLLRTILDRILGSHTKELFKNVKPLPKQIRARKPLTVEELQKMIIVCDEESDFKLNHKEEYRCFLRFMAFASMRGDDACHPLWENICFNTPSITYTPIKTMRYHPEPVTTPLHDELYHSLWCLWEKRDPDEQYVLPNVHARFHQYEGALGETMKTIMHAADIKTQIDGNEFIRYAKYETIDKVTGKKVTKRRKICIKSMSAPRHYFATQAKDNSVSPIVIQEIMVHESPEMQGNYTHVNLADKKAAIDRMPRLVPEKNFDQFKYVDNNNSIDELKKVIVDGIPNLEIQDLLEIIEIVDRAKKLTEIKNKIQKESIPHVTAKRMNFVLFHTNENIGRIFQISGSMVSRYLDKYKYPKKRKRIFKVLNEQEIIEIRQALIKCHDSD